MHVWPVRLFISGDRPTHDAALEIALEVEDDSGTCVRFRVELGLDENKRTVVKVETVFYYIANNKLGIARRLINNLYMSSVFVGIL